MLYLDGPGRLPQIASKGNTAANKTWISCVKYVTTVVVEESRPGQKVIKDEVMSAGRVE